MDTQKLLNWRTQTPIYPLVTLRVAFGLLMLVSTIRFVAFGWVEDHFISPVLHFSYFGFDWIKPLGGETMYVIHGLMMLACVGIILGFWYRISALTFALLFTYTELIDITYYLNHYYFISLFSFLMVLLPAHRFFSLDVRRNPEKRCTHIPVWLMWVVWGQIGILYVYAGLAKLNTIWLFEALPLKIWLPAHTHLPLIGGLFRYEWTAYAFSWFGMLYDTFIVAFLLWRPTRPWAYLTVVAFHLMTGLLFQIGMFPYVMMAITLVFFSPEWHLRWMSGLSTKILGKGIDYQGGNRRSYTLSLWLDRLLKPALLLYLAFHLLFPWRYLLYDGNLFWNEEGYRFSWRVMLMEKAGTATFYVKDGPGGREGIVDNSEFLNPHQEKQMAMQPDLILQYAHFLADHFQENGMQNPQVRAEVYVTLNGRPSQLLIDPEVNLVEIEDGWRQKEWVLPFDD